MKCAFHPSLLIAAGMLLAGSRPAHALQEVAVPCTAAGNTAFISYGEHASCTISNLGEVDLYQFFGTAGDVVLIGIAGTTHIWGPQIELFAPTDPLVPLAVGGCLGAPFGLTCSGSKVATLPTTGVYAIRVFDYQNNHTGSYQLNLERMPHDGQVAILNYGATAVVTLEHRSDVDWFAFDALSGSQVQLTATASASTGVLVQVVDAAGVVLTSSQCGTGCAALPIMFFPPADGRYYIAVQDLNYDQTGTITVALACVVGNCPTTTPIPSIGSSYCQQTPNSTAAPALISALGSRHVADNDVYLVVNDLPTQKQGLFFMGLQPYAGPVTIGCGALCITPPLVRRPAQFTSSSGTLNLRLDLTHPEIDAIVNPGSPTYFQAWFRDPTGAGGCSATTNTSDGLRINFL